MRHVLLSQSRDYTHRGHPLRVQRRLDDLRRLLGAHARRLPLKPEVGKEARGHLEAGAGPRGLTRSCFRRFLRGFNRVECLSREASPHFSQRVPSSAVFGLNRRKWAATPFGGWLEAAEGRESSGSRNLESRPGGIFQSGDTPRPGEQRGETSGGGNQPIGLGPARKLPTI